MTRHAMVFSLFLVASGSLLLIGGCATSALEIDAADKNVTPQQAAADIAKVRQRTVAWGGIILAGTNLKDSTQLEVLGYPLDDRNRPQADAAPIGRFIVVHPGYLETADYAPGRQITIVGEVTGARTGTVGEAQYVYPVVATQRVHLWPKTPRERTEPSIHFGIGIGIIR